MNKKRILVAILSFALSVCAVFGLTACNKGHTHDFGTAYKYNEQQHWKECECTEKSDVADHSFNEDGVCVCGYELVKEEKSLMDLFKSLSEIDLAGGVNVTLDGDVFVDDIEAPYYTEADYGNEQTIALDIAGTLDGEIYFGINEEDKIEINGAVLLDAVGKDENEKEFLKLTAEAYVVMADDVIYLKYDVDGSFPGLDESLQELPGNFMKQAGQMSITVEDIIGMIPEEAIGIMTMIGGIIEENAEFINSELVPLLDRIWGDVDEIVEKIVEVNLESMFKLTEVEDKYEVVYDFDKIKANAEKLFDTPMATYIDEMLGEGTFEALKNGVVGVLDLKLSDIVNYVFTTEGLTIKELEDKINEIGKSIDPEFDLATLLHIEGSLADFIETDEMKAMLSMTIGELIVGTMGNGSGPEDINPMSEEAPDLSAQVEELKAQIIAAFDMAGDMTFYDAIMMLVPSTDVDPEEMKQQVEEMTALIFDIAKDVFGYKIIFNEDGKFEKLVIGYTVEQETIDKITALIPTEAGVVFVGGGSVIATVTLGEFANALEVDYDAIIAGFAEVA
ncbi:MAG: hypothetical protein IJB32_00295 [Clostridia bacterium]|nr:hypothetical protein [Clostridia bacterium]